MSRTLTERQAKVVGMILLFGSSILLPLSVIEHLRPIAALAEPPNVAQPKKVYVRPSMLAIPLEPGESFLMGSPLGEDGRFEDETQHRVTLAGRFALSQTEVTRGQYRLVMKRNPKDWDICDRSDEPRGDDSEYPVVCLSFGEAAKYCNALTKLEYPGGVDEKGQPVQPCYVIKDDDVQWSSGFACRGYRLPTEAEWEYAARARRWTLYAGTDQKGKVCDYANVADLYARAKHPDWSTFDCRDGSAGPASVDGRAHNGWFLQDMTGNVWERVWDWYGDNSIGQSIDKGGSPDGSARVIRGGSWGYDARYARVSNRNWRSPDYRDLYLGFRLSRSLP